MSPQQTALARSRTYALFGRLFLYGITTEFLPTLHVIPELSLSLPSPFEADEIAALHYRLLQLNVFPYESFFLDPSGLIGGEMTDQVLIHYQQAGYMADSAVPSPDHVGCELDFVAFLCLAEAEAWEDGRPQTADHLHQLQAKFLQAHLLRWLPPFVIALKQENEPFYTALADLLLAMLAEHHGRLPSIPSLPFALPSLPTLLEDEKTGSKDIVAFLVTPSLSGIFLSRDVIGRLGRSQSLPRGFGGREQMLVNLWQTAVQYDAFPALLTALQEVAAEWQNAYREMENLIPQGITAVWLTRTIETNDLLAQIRLQLGQHHLE